MTQERKGTAYLHLDLYEGTDGQIHMEISGDGILLDQALMLCALRQDHPEIFAVAEELYNEMQGYFPASNDNNYLTRN